MFVFEIRHLDSTMIALVEKLNSFSYTTAFSGIDAPGVDAVTREDFDAVSIS